MYTDHETCQLFVKHSTYVECESLSIKLDQFSHSPEVGGGACAPASERIGLAR